MEMYLIGVLIAYVGFVITGIALYYHDGEFTLTLGSAIVLVVLGFGSWVILFITSVILIIMMAEMYIYPWWRRKSIIFDKEIINCKRGNGDVM